jgi:Fe-S-cluster containining protein
MVGLTRKTFNCVRCGECCKQLPIDIGYSDIIKWEDKNRNDILREVRLIGNFPIPKAGGFYFEKTLQRKGKEKSPCPFYDGDGCSIYSLRPFVCRGYPKSTKNATCSSAVPVRKWIREFIQKQQQRDYKKSIDNRNMLLDIIDGALNGNRSP